MRFAMCSLIPAAMAAVLALAPASEARAGDLTNARLGCYVDTYAYDYTQPDECFGVWVPNGADNPSVAVFEVIGLTPGNYSFHWSDLATGQSGVCSSAYPACVRTIYTNQSQHLQVTIYDHATGASKTVSAYAQYFDGWN